MRLQRCVRAFTLIELLVVILIIAVMAGTVVPAYARFLEKSRFQTQVRYVQDLFAFAREQAVQKDTTVTVDYDPRNAMFVATVTPPAPTTDQPSAFAAMNGGDTSQETEIIPPHVTRLGEEYAVASFKVGTSGVTQGANGNSKGGSSTELHFLSDGTVEGADLVIASNKGYLAHLVLWPSTGRLTLEEEAQQ